MLERDHREAGRRLEAAAIRQDSQTPAQSLVQLASEKGLTLATVESCTGGLIGKMITDVPGASRVYRGGWITYSNQMKHDQLGVSMQTLHKHGAVSGPVATAMARGAWTRSEADLSVAVTGIAGPGGGTPNKPTGTVWVAVCVTAPQKESQAKRTPVTENIELRGLQGDRATIRDYAAKTALQCLYLAALGQPISRLTALNPPDGSHGSV